MAVLYLPLPRLDKFKDSLYWRYGFSLTAHEVTLKFATGTKELAKKWYDALRKLGNVVLLHFSRDYNLGKSLKRNGYGKTRLATRVETGAPCIVRSVIKATLFENCGLLVPSLTPSYY